MSAPPGFLPRFKVKSGSIVIPVMTATVVAGGCVSKMMTDPDVSPVENRRMMVGKSGYQQIYETGSNLPVYVPTSPTARPLPSASGVTTMSAEALRDLIRRGQTGGR